MAALVVKQWVVSDEPVDDAENYIIIKGRKSGVIAWFLSLVGVDPTTEIKVSMTRIEFSKASLSGTSTRIIPIIGVCSTYYGYHKPWKQALGILFTWLFLAVGLSYSLFNENMGSWVFILGTLVVAGLSLVYYLLNRTLTLGFVEYSGVINGIMFKRSIIENIDVNEDQARLVCELTQAIVEKAQSHN